MELFDKKFVYLEWDDVLKGKKVFAGNTLPQLRVLVDGNRDSLQEISKNVSEESFYPFISHCGTWCAMVYYDPNYECKVAYMQGKVIQFRNKGDTNWIDTNSPNWIDRCEYRVKSEEEEHKLVFASNGCLSLDTEDVPCILYTGTKEQCLKYATDVMCGRCINSKTCSPDGSCRGFRELKAVKKRRMTNRELAKWVAQGNGLARFMPTGMTGIDYIYDSNEENEPVSDDWKICGWDETEWHVPEVEG